MYFCHYDFANRGQKIFLPFFQKGVKTFGTLVFFYRFDVKFETMKEERKLDTFIQIRVFKKQKQRWSDICQEQGISMTNLITSAVENRLLNSDRKEILTFIDKQANYFSKVENNINQIAKTVNSEKQIHSSLLNYYNEQLKELSIMKDQQNKMFKKILNFLAQ